MRTDSVDHSVFEETKVSVNLLLFNRKLCDCQTPILNQTNVSHFFHYKKTNFTTSDNLISYLLKRISILMNKFDNMDYYSEE